MRYADACRVFGCIPYTVDGAHNQYKALARKCHPDLNGGDRTRWDELQEAYRVIMEDLKRPRRCGECGGSGQRVVMKRGRRVAVACDCQKKE